LESLPFGICATPSLNKLLTKYVDTVCFFEKSDSLSHLDSFIKSYIKKDNSTFKEIILGLQEWQLDMEKKYSNTKNSSNSISLFSRDTIDSTLDLFFQKRLSSRLIAKNYLSIVEEKECIVNENVDTTVVLENAYAEARQVCENKYGVSPRLVVKNNFDGKFSYLASHFHFILFEILKNSMEASVLKCNSHLPPVTVEMVNYENNLLLLVHDDGVGVSPQDLIDIWSYFYSSSSHEIDHSLIFDDRKIMSGFGFGLPLTKMLVQYFGGNIALNSIKGSSTDVHVYFQGNENSVFNRINIHHKY